MVASRQSTIGQQVEQIWAKGQGNALIINNDLVNQLFVSQSNVISANDLTIPPLGSMGVDGTSNWYASTLANYGIVTGIAPGVTQWAPSPAQVAAQINALGLAKDSSVQSVNSSVVATNTAVTGVNTTLGSPAQDSIRTAIPNNISTTGVPLLTNQNVAASSSGGTAIGASAVLTVPASGTLALNQIGFELFVSAKYTTTNGTNPFIMCVVYFIDSVTGLTIDQTQYVLTVGNTTGALPQRIKGPTKANSCRVVFYNLDTAQSVTVSYSLMINSRPYTQDAIDWLVSSFVGLPGTVPSHTLAGTILPDTNTLAIFSNSALAVSGSDGWLCPPQIGPLYLNIWESGVGSANMQVSVQEVPSSVYGGTTPWLINDTMTAGNPDKFNATFYAGRAPLQINIKNAGSVAANYIGMLISGVAD